eukprot:g29158.t1
MATEVSATGYVPADWRVANAVPLFKKGNRDNPGNYRPEVMKVINEGGAVNVVYMDFSKTLNKVAHGRVIQKIKIHGICGDLATWIQNWLAHSRQMVEVEVVFQAWRKDVEALERVQKRFTRMLPGFEDMSYKERLEKLELFSLEWQKLRGDMIEVYKIMKCIDR